MAAVSLNGVRKRFGAVEIIKGIDLEIADGEFCVFVGPSGCGKSTLLRLIAGLEEISDGSLQIGGKDMTRTAPANRGVAMVFQSYALYPHMTVAENITFGMKMAGAPKDEIARRLAKAAKMLQLGDYLARKPSQLSGGQRQRVAIGRAIVREPDVFLFDEPLSNLDAALRVQTRIEIGGLHQDLAATMIYVTHDQVEAMTMADKIVVLQAGRIEQVGSPMDLYHTPKNIFVAGFIGSPKMNFLKFNDKQTDGQAAKVKLPNGGQLSLPLSAAKLPDGAVTMGVRPEHLTVGGGGDAAFHAEVKLAERLGSETMLHMAMGDGTMIIVKADGLNKAKPGEMVPIGISHASCHLFGADGRTVINGSLL